MRCRGEEYGARGLDGCHPHSSSPNLVRPPPPAPPPHLARLKPHAQQRLDSRVAWRGEGLHAVVEGVRGVGGARGPGGGAAACARVWGGCGVGCMMEWRACREGQSRARTPARRGHHSVVVRSPIHLAGCPCRTQTPAKGCGEVWVCACVCVCTCTGVRACACVLACMHGSTWGYKRAQGVQPPTSAPFCAREYAATAPVTPAPTTATRRGSSFAAAVLSANAAVADVLMQRPRC